MRYAPIGSAYVNFNPYFGYFLRLDTSFCGVSLNLANYEADFSDDSSFLDGFSVFLRYDATIRALFAPHARLPIIGHYLFNTYRGGVVGPDVRLLYDRGEPTVPWAYQQRHPLPRWHAEQMTSGGFRDHSRYATVGKPSDPLQIMPDRANGYFLNEVAHFIGSFGRRISALSGNLLWGFPPASALSAFVPWAQVVAGGAVPGWFVRLQYFDINRTVIATHDGPTQPLTYLGTYNGLDFYGIASSVDLASFSVPPAAARSYYAQLRSVGTFYTDTVNGSQLRYHYDHDLNPSIAGMHFPMYNCEDSNDWIPGFTIDP